MSTIVWKPGYGGNWASASEWTVYGSNPPVHRVPGAGDTADIGLDGSANVVTFNSVGAVVGAIDEGNQSSFDMLSGSLDITGRSQLAGFLTVAGGTLTAGQVLGANGVFTLDHGATLDVTNTGLFAMQSGTVSGTVNVATGGSFSFDDILANEGEGGGADTASGATFTGGGYVFLGLDTILTVSGQVAIADTFEMGPSTIAGSGTLTLTGGGGFSGSDPNTTIGMVGTGKTVLKSNFTIDGGVREVPDVIGLDGGRVLENAGSLKFINGAYIDLGFVGGSGATVINDASGIINFSNASVSYGGRNIGNINGGILNLGGTSSVVNSGTIEVTGTVAGYTDTISARLTNTSTGILLAQTGVLDLTGGGVLAGGIGAYAGAEIELGGGSFTLSSLSNKTAGDLLLSAGTLAINATTTANIGAYFFQTGGTIAGTGLLALSNGGRFVLGSSYEVGKGLTRLLGDSGIGSTGTVNLDGGRTFEVYGDLTVYGAINLGFAGGAGGTIRNDTSATMVFESGSDVTDIGGSDRLYNSGTLLQEGGPGTSTIGVSLTNAATGIIVGYSGVLDLTGGGVLAGHMGGTVGATIELGGGSFALSGTSGLTGGDLLLATGTLSVAAGVTTKIGMQFAQSGGTVNGSGVVVLDDGADFRAGIDVQLGNAHTFLYGSSSVDAGAAVDLDGGRILFNVGTLAWKGGNFDLGFAAGGGGALQNYKSALLDITGGGAVYNGGGNSLLINQGTLLNQTATKTTTIGVRLTNASTGLLDVASGILDLTDGGILAGRMVTNAGGTLELGGGSFTVSGSSTLSSGAFELSGATMVVSSGSAVTIGAVFAQFGGAIEGPGTLVLAQGALFGAASDEEILGGRTVLDKTSAILHGASVDLDDGHLLENAGTLIWDGNIDLGFANGTGGSVRNDAGAVMQIIQSAGAMYAGSGANGFLNAGTLVKSSGTATTTIAATLTNAGTILASSGVIDFTGGGSSAGVLIAQNKAAIEFGAGYFSIKNVSQAGTSGGFIELTGSGTLGVGTSLTGGLGSEFYQGGGTIAGAGTLLLSGGAILASGNDAEIGTGKTLLKGASTIRSGADVLLDAGRTLENAGTLHWQGGNLDFGFANGTGGTLVNDAGATLLINQAGDTAYFSGGSDAIVNSGLTEIYGAGTTPTNIGVSLTNTSTGQLSVLRGILALNGGGYSSGAIAVTAGATLSFGAGYFTLAGGSTSTTAGEVLLSGGTLGVAAGATAIVGARFAQSGGTIAGAGALTLANGTSFESGTDAEIGAGRTVLKGATSVVSGAAIDLDGGRLLENTGALTWTGGSFNLGFAGGAGATLDNDAGATFNIRQDAGAIYNSGGTSALVNAGTLIKSTGTGTTDIGVSLINGGTIVAASGVLEFSGGGSSAGVLEATSHGTLELGGGYFSIKGTGAAGDGTGVVELAAGTLAVAAGLTATINAKFVQIGGEIAGAGSLVLARGFEFSDTVSLGGIGSGSTVLESQSTIDFDTALAFDNGRTLENAGTLTWEGGAPSIIRLGAYGNQTGATIRNDAGAVIDFAGDSNYGIVASGGTDNFINAGTVIKSAGTGANTIEVAVTNAGTILAASGVLNLSGAVSRRQQHAARSEDGAGVGDRDLDRVRTRASRLDHGSSIDEVVGAAAADDDDVIMPARFRIAPGRLPVLLPVEGAAQQAQRRVTHHADGSKL